MNDQEEKLSLNFPRLYELKDQQGFIYGHILDNKDVNMPSRKWLMSLDKRTFEYLLNVANECVENARRFEEIEKYETSDEEIDLCSAALILLTHDYNIHFGKPMGEFGREEASWCVRQFMADVIIESLRRKGAVEYFNESDWTVYDETLKVGMKDTVAQLLKERDLL